MLARFHGDPFSSRLACGQHRVFSVKLLITPASFAHIETSVTDAISFLQLLRKGGKDSLYLAVNPQKLLFMSIDGVAPKAKVKEQRGRRFRAGYVLKSVRD